MNKADSDESEISQVQVRLPVVFGILPKTYIIPLGIFILLVLFFLIVIFPSFIFTASRIEITSNIQNASVFIDGKRVGLTPMKAYIPSGKHEVSLTKKNFETIKTEVYIPRQWFGRLFGFSQKKITKNFNQGNAINVLRSAVFDFSQWSLSSENSLTSVRRMPPILSRASLDLQNLAQFEGGIKLKDEDYIQFFRATAAHIGNSELAKDWADAWILLNGLQKETSALEILDSYSLLENHNTKDVFLDVFGALPQKTPGQVIKKTEYVQQKQKIQYGPAQFSLFKSNDDFTVAIADQELSRNIWRLFLDAKPEWSRENTNKLLELGLVDKRYLENFYTDKNMDAPISFVSKPAVEAFLQWFSEEYLLNTSYKATLPSLADWENIDTSIGIQAGSGPWLVAGQALSPLYSEKSGTLAHWHGGLFEWTASSAGLHSSKQAVAIMAQAAYPGFQYHLAGGGITLSKKDYETAGPNAWAYPLDWCGEFVGFRIWLKKVNEGLQ